MLVRICNNMNCDNECLTNKLFCYNCCNFKKYYNKKQEQLYEYYTENDNETEPPFKTGRYHFIKRWLAPNAYQMVYKNL